MDKNATPAHILLVDDDSSLTTHLADYLIKHYGYTVTVAASGEEALERLETVKPAVIVLDVKMGQGKMNGYDVLDCLRARGDWTPVIMLSIIGGEPDERTKGLRLKANDYLSKPFDYAELEARIRAVLLPRPEQLLVSKAQILTCDNLRFDRQTQRVYLGDQEVKLSHRARMLLEYMMIHHGTVLNREQILNAVWGTKFIEQRVIDIRIRELRRVLKDDPRHPIYIETVPGEGYCFIGSVRATE